MNNPAEAAGQWDWEAWSQSLADHFFTVDRGGMPVHFYVDEATLSDITGLPGPQAIQALMSPVRAITPGHSYRAVAAMARRWGNSDRSNAPPSLPLLAVCVLAATRMGETGAISPANYYKPYRQLFDPNDNSSGAPGDYGEVIPGLWDQLNSWLDEDKGGSLGRSTIRPHANFTWIGYALSQTLLRASDRRQLDRFFRWMQIDKDAGDLPSGAEMRRLLGHWAKTQHSTAAHRLERIATTESMHTLCEQALTEALASWDPTRHVDVEGGRPQASLRIVLRETPFELGLAAERPDGFPEAATFATAGDATEARLEAAIEGWYRPVPLPAIDMASALHAGLTLAAEGRALVLEPSTVYALAFNGDLGRYTSEASIQLGRSYHLLVASSARTEVTRFCADEGIPAKIIPSLTSRLPGGQWFLFEGFQLNASATSTPPADLAQLIGGGGGPRLRLIGGLKIGPSNGSRLYLTGGAPNLACPPDITDRTFALQWSGYEEPHSFVAPQGTGEFPLNDLQLQAGSYAVTYGDLSLAFDLVDGLIEHTAQTAAEVHSHGADGDASGYLVNRPEGAPIEVPPKVPVVTAAPAPGVYRALLGPGPADFERPHAPEWLSALAGGLTWSFVEHRAPFDPVWAACSDGSKFSVTLLSPHEPRPEPGTSDSYWCRLITQAVLEDGETEEAQRLWSAYKAALKACA